MPVLLPRAIEPMQVSVPNLPSGLVSVAQAGRIQRRTTAQAGRIWRERWPLMRMSDPEALEILAFLDDAWSQMSSFEAQHLLLPGSGRPIRGVGEENLVRSAAMDTDTDLDGAVDDFISSVEGDAIFTFSLDGAKAAQKITVAAAGVDAAVDRGGVVQDVLSIREGDQITVSVEVETANLAGMSGRVLARWHRSDGSFISQLAMNGIVEPAFARRELTGVAPAETDRVQIRLQLDGTDGTGDIWYRNARLIHAAADPAIFAKPRVEGAAQTGRFLLTSGWPASTSQLLRRGDYLRIGDEVIMRMVAADVTSDAAGIATVEVVPQIYAAPADGDVLRLAGNYFNLMLWEREPLPETLAMDWVGGVSAIFREVLT